MRYLFAFWALFAIACTAQVEPTAPADPPETETDMAPSRSNMAAGQKLKTRAPPQTPNYSMSLQSPDLPSGEYSVQFNMITPSAQARTALQQETCAQAEALIEWSVQGVTTFRRVSIADGTTVSGTAEKVRVTITDRSTSVSSDPDADFLYDVFVTFAKGSRASTQQPPIYIPKPTPPTAAGPGATGVLAPGATASWEIPPDVGAISIFVTATIFLGQAPLTLPQGSVQVEMINSGGGGVVNIYDPVVDNTWVPLVPGTTSVIVRNNTNLGADQRNIIYSVYIGVDG